MALVEYRRGGRQNCIFILEDKDGRGWRKLAEVLREAGREGCLVGLAPPATTVASSAQSYVESLQQQRVPDCFRELAKLGAVSNILVRLRGSAIISIGAQSLEGGGRGAVDLNKDMVLWALSDLQRHRNDVQLNISC
ncbi:hypothetical protein CIPAW_01G088500 [Carya illinoinensis]|uniref:Uncharacterized protein n=1 Tax=Carya illinoinensis TaxID=32201 RepID=A0A8T1RIM9_CARIL|nr:hypothetical protein CIPAW_01G088500 [Carya illinoinensis]